MDESYIGFLVNWLVIEVPAIRLCTNRYIIFITTVVSLCAFSHQPVFLL